MSLLSSQEAHLVGDIVSELAQAHAFVGDMDREEFLTDDKTVYAVEKAVQNVTEACIQLNGKRGADRFAALFPDFPFEDLRTLGNRLRHDYGAIDRNALWDALFDELPPLQIQAEALLADQRRAFGRPDDPPTE